MKKILSLAIITVFILTGTGFSKMRGGGPDNLKMPHGKWWRLPDIQKSLNVTPDEQKKLDTLYIKSRKKMVDLKADVQKAKINLEEIMDSEVFDKAACLKQFKTLETAKGRLATERFTFITEIRDLFGQERYLKLETERKAIKKGYTKRNAKDCRANGNRTYAGKLKNNCPVRAAQ